MTPTWRSDHPPPVTVIGWLGWGLAAGRGVALLMLMATGLAVLALVRLGEAILANRARPLSHQIPRIVCRLALLLLGIRLLRTGQFDPAASVVVANHASWLDILVLNALGPMTFVAKSEVAGWAGIGHLARATGTLFIARDRKQARQQEAMIRHRLAEGQRLTLFPEGTSTDGLRVLAFKPTLFAALFAADRQSKVQPVSIRYLPPAGVDPRFYGWWGAMDFGPHALAVLAQTRRGKVRVVLAEALDSSSFADRKALALACETAVRQGHQAGNS